MAAQTLIRPPLQRSGYAEITEVTKREEIVNPKIKKLLESPKAFVTDAIKNRKNAVLMESKAALFTANEKKTIALAGFSNWKIWIEDYYPEKNIFFLGHSATLPVAKLKTLDVMKPDEIWMWSYKFPGFLLEYAAQNDIPVAYVEDGFIRSVGLGIDKTKPLSLVFDRKAMHFDRTRTSALEDILAEFDFAGNPALLDQAREVIGTLRQYNISKYTFRNADASDLSGKKRGILVLGQVEDDYSIRFGVEGAANCNELVRIAARENPGLPIYYRPHPESIRVAKPHYSRPQEVADICEILPQSVSLAACFGLASRVYTYTSLAGFEAACQGLPVTVVGCPFYAGWGFTDDVTPIPRRTRNLNPIEVFAAAYLLYPIYFDPVSNRQISAADAVEIVKRQVHGAGG